MWESGARFGGQGARAAVAARADFSTLSLSAGRTHQRDRGAMPKELWEPRVIAKPQREHVAFAVEHDRLPPPVGEAPLRDDEVARRDLLPAAWQATGDRGAGLVVVWADRRLLRFGRQRDKHVAVEGLPHVRHERAAGGVELADRQPLRHVSDIR